MLTPRPWQIAGAEFLASRRTAGLFDQPRVGKTLASILACNMVGAESVGVITTRSGIPVWQRAFDTGGLLAPKRLVISWGSDIRAFARDEWDVLIVDESHKAANPDSERTKAVYGELGPDGMFDRSRSAVARAKRVWCLSGTPAPHDNGNWWPMIRSLTPAVLEGSPHDLWPHVRSWRAFRERYCVIGMKKRDFGPPIPVVVGGKNETELRDRLNGFFLRRTQAEVGIAEPTYDLLPVTHSVSVHNQALRAAERNLDRERVLAAAEAGDTDKLDLMLAEIMRLTGEIKAAAMWPVVNDEIKGGAGKIVLAYWHRSVGDILEEDFGPLGVLRLDGSSTAAHRDYCQETWNGEHPWGSPQIFLCQMEAGGEAIDLSASANMIIVEPVFRPATMFQVAQRIVNMEKKRTPLVRVTVLAGSIDEIVQERLLALWAPIKEVLRK